MNDMIERAKRMARLADKATSGPWRLRYKEGDKVIRLIDQYENFVGVEAHKNALTNALLAAAAPEMAKLLGQMADEIERLQEEVDKHKE